MDLIRRNQEYRNFVSIYSGLTFVGEKCQGYTENKLDETFKAIYKKLAGKPPCHQQCSKVHKDKTARWCDTCNSWRRELSLTRVHHHSIAWSNMDSSNWPASYNNIAEVYLPSSWNIPDFQDVGTACHIWTNLTKCTINRWTIKRMKKVRNVYFAHNSRLSATDLEKSQVFDVFRDLLNDPDLNDYINRRECIDELFGLKDANDKQLANIENYIVEVNKRQTSWGLHSFCNYTLCSLTWTVERIRLKWRTIKKYNVFMVLLVACLLSLLYPSGEIHQEVGCLSEDYNYPFEQDMRLLGYLSEHETLVGREWLFDEIRVSIFKNSIDDSKSIIALVAEMGYGKSALVANMLCANQYSQSHIIRKHIVGFHICKFDVRSTHAPERFIMRLVGFLARKSAEYGKEISMLPRNSILYSADKCMRDYLACFDQGITFPLKKIKGVIKTPWIIVIDALDECETSGENYILQLLSSRSSNLPKFVKFLVTSRNTSLVTLLDSFERSEINHLLANDTRNIQDITDYIFQRLSDPKLVNKLVNYSDGNFVYVVQAIKWVIANSNTDQIPKLPVGLEEVYKINFDRSFKYESYTIPRMILEIVCSAGNPIGKSYIFQILSKNNVTQNTSEFDKHFHSLSFFLNVDDIVRLTHQALFHWLVNERNFNYRISLERGHYFISQYFFSMTSTLGPNDLVDLAIHVSNSDDQTLVDLFQCSNFSKNIIEGNSLLHKLIWKTEDTRSLKLLMGHTKTIDGFNKGKVTPIFVAASKGHSFQLELLHKMGADLNFQVSGDFLIQDTRVESKIYEIKHVHYSGYSLLHIASQNGHTNITKYLIQQNESLLLVKNALGLHPGLVACENGFLDVIKEMFYVNQTLFRDERLYYASKHNHLHIVKWLVSKGVKLTCISDDSSLSAFHEITRVQQNDSLKFAESACPFHGGMPNLIHPLDKWWQVFKFDPLLAGIRNGSIQTAQYLIEKFPKSLKCSDVFGFSAALATVAFNRSELLPFVVNNLITDKCQPVPVYVRQSSLTFVKNQLLSNACPEGAVLAHVLSLYDFPNIFTYVVQHDLVTHWNKADAEGFLPVHYAAMKYNVRFLKYYKGLGHLYENAKSSKDVTVFHISAVNDLLAFITGLGINFLEPIPDLKDSNDHNILHYLVSRKFYELHDAYEYGLHNDYTKLFVHLIKTYKHDFMSRDGHRRNILHYALLNGHFKIVRYLTEFKKSQIRKMLFQKDLFGDQPLAFSLIRYHRNTIFTIPLCLDCINFKIIDEELVTTLLSAWELSLLQIIKQLSKSEFKELLEPHLSHIWSKSVYLLVAVVNNHHQHLDNHLLRSLLLHHNGAALIGYNQLVLALFIPSVFDYCTSDYMPIDSPLLYIVRNFDYKNTLFSLNYEYGWVIYHKILLSLTTTGRSICTDKFGYNIVYHAVKTGNIQTAKILIEHGLKVTSPAIDVKGIFLAALTARRRVSETNFYGCSSELAHTTQATCTDIFLTEVLKLNDNTLTAADFCMNGTSGLSLVHILSANGMLQTLKRLVEVFSSQILACYNKDRFTPLYLAQTFNQDAVVYFISSKTEIYFPDRYAEEYLIISLLKDFPLKKYWLCFKMHEFNRRQFARWYYCAYVILRQLSLSKQYSLKKFSGIVQHVWGDLHNLMTCTDFFDYHAAMNSLPECETFVRACFICYGDAVRLQTSIRGFNVLKTTGQFPKGGNYMKLERLVELSMKRMLIAADKNFCSRYHQGLFNILHTTVANTIMFGQRAIKDLALSYFVQLKQSEVGYAPHEYSFLRSRLAIYGLPGSITNITPLPHNFILNAHSYYYLDILSNTLSYSDIKDAIGEGTTAVAIYKPKFKLFKIENIRLDDPFADLH